MKRLALILFLALPVQAVTNKGQHLGSDNGRFVFGQVSEFRTDQYLIDTQTGKLWVLIKLTEGGVALSPVPYLQNPAKDIHVEERK